MAEQRQRDAGPAERMSFEAAMRELESIIDSIERGELGLEESLAARRRGEILIRRCRSILEVAEQELTMSAADDQPGADPVP
jgi:exodeoxyribonuclease VII small subunit